jgi:hypothetical protein
MELAMDAGQLSMRHSYASLVLASSSCYTVIEAFEVGASGA